MSEFHKGGPLVLEEMMKSVSLLENPPEAKPLRNALALYKIPDDLEFKWGENHNLMIVMRHLACPQEDWELNQMLKLIAGKRSLLEIGSSFGGTLQRMASVMPKGSKIVSVDLPYHSTDSGVPRFMESLASLKDACRKIAYMGGNVELVLGDSHDKETVEAVRKHSPFDFGFIDGDHTYEGAKADWENYGPMCRTIGFHDIAGGLGCTNLWQELKGNGKNCEEFVHPSRKMGIGIIYQNGRVPLLP